MSPVEFPIEVGSFLEVFFGVLVPVGDIQDRYVFLDIPFQAGDRMVWIIFVADFPGLKRTMKFRWLIVIPGGEGLRLGKKDIPVRSVHLLDDSEGAPPPGWRRFTKNFDWPVAGSGTSRRGSRLAL